jgi:hypothetical protein
MLIFSRFIGGSMKTSWKLYSIVLVGSMALLFACSHKTRADSKKISATADSKGSHPATTAVNGPVVVTCISATDDSGKATPPACVVDGPGASGVVDIGRKVAITGAGNVVLSCHGSGTLACTAEIEE